MEYTKGEWIKGSHNDEPLARPFLNIYQEDGRLIAEASREGLMPFEEVEANAQLISASPDLYEACKEIVRWMREWQDPEFHFGHLLEWAEKALAKAEGN